jgi:hypothetical protein
MPRIGCDPLLSFDFLRTKEAMYSLYKEKRIKEESESVVVVVSGDDELNGESSFCTKMTLWLLLGLARNMEYCIMTGKKGTTTLFCSCVCV